ncbi:helix-turn-helix transcriptional regulator [Siphonobacter sp. SORGH_AS_1065]|uniref:helix-turn-helix transcriptional regulator n=1 Tax=Siphonobacter sp. SORGH_AS_1065 TaxID=3041795 RepID=UPI00277E3D9D|nr:helix-turn-helix transcriptional regulator [Siphonobacter sp. SORGH_AS_1065]MDQ1088889.1 transcriptional regulator with XRE-family HTH domain [Siphonobacter sp. SORGH_AS_1065]
MSIISENIRYLRNRNDLTQEQLARRLGTKRPNIGAYEEARANPPRETLIKLSQLFGVTLDQLLTADLRRIRDTPSLNLGTSAPPPPVYRAEPSRPPQPIQKVVDTYFRQKSQVNLVAQRVTLRKLNRLDYPAATLPVEKPKSFDTPNQTPTLTPSVNAPSTNVSQDSGIRLVKKEQTSEYLTKSRQGEYIQQLPPFQGPRTQSGVIRAFEVGEDFSIPGSIIIAEQVNDWYKLEDSKHYVIVARPQGIMYRRVYNQLKIKSTLLLSSDNPAIQTLEVSSKDIIEVWAVKGFYSTQLPEPPLSLDRMKALVEELKMELDRVK